MTRVLDINHDFPIRTEGPVHSGKVRSVYWLTPEDSRRLNSERGYNLPEGTPLALMIVSDRISAFDCIWHGENGLRGVPGKGAALNAVSMHWFDSFRREGLASSHVVEVPHPLVWIVQRAQPVRIEAIARRYITGSMWRAYAAGERTFCGVQLPEGLGRDQRLSELLITPSTKGVIQGLDGVPEQDDANISRDVIEQHWQAFGFAEPGDVGLYETLLRRGFEVIEQRLAGLGQIFVDTKFEFGYVTTAQDQRELIYMDEVGTPDSSRIWDAAAYERGQVVENSKEEFRQALLALCPDPDILLNKNRMPERQVFAATTALPESLLEQVSQTYVGIAEKIIGGPVTIPECPREEIDALLTEDLGLRA